MNFRVEELDPECDPVLIYCGGSLSRSAHQNDPGFIMKVTDILA